MKYLVMLCDGMADELNAQLDNSTPMAKAVKPCMDYLASKGEVGMVKTVAEGLKPGSDVANLSVLGYEPAVYYSGRSPLEAASIGIDLKDTDHYFFLPSLIQPQCPPRNARVILRLSSSKV